jgi:hypothetical protein
MSWGCAVADDAAWQEAERRVDSLLTLLAQETYRLHGAAGGNGADDPDLSPWADRWRTDDMASASASLRESYAKKVEPYRPALTAWVEAWMETPRATDPPVSGEVARYWQHPQTGIVGFDAGAQWQAQRDFDASVVVPQYRRRKPPPVTRNEDDE